MQWASLEDTRALEEECTWAERDVPVTLYELLTRTKNNFGSRPAVSYQLTSGPKDKAETLSGMSCIRKPRKRRICSVPWAWGQMMSWPISCQMPPKRFCPFWRGCCRDCNPINPLLDADQIAAILRETNAKVVVTLKAFPKPTSTKGGRSGGRGPKCQAVIEVDLLRYLTFPKSVIVPLIRPKNPVSHQAKSMILTH